MKVGLHLRQAMFVSGVLFNSEVWNSITKEDITRLEVIDHQLMIVICVSHSKTPTGFLYLETAEKPLGLIITSRRLNHLHHILQKDESDMVKENTTKVTSLI